MPTPTREGIYMNLKVIIICCTFVVLKAVRTMQMSVSLSGAADAAVEGRRFTSTPLSVTNTWNSELLILVKKKLV